MYCFEGVVCGENFSLKLIWFSTFPRCSLYLAVRTVSSRELLCMQAIKMKTSQPLFLLVGEAGDLDQEFPSCLEVQREPPGFSGVQDAVDIEQECSTSGFIFSFPEVCRLLLNFASLRVLSFALLPGSVGF